MRVISFLLNIKSRLNFLFCSFFKSPVLLYIFMAFVFGMLISSYITEAVISYAAASFYFDANTIGACKALMSKY